ncbi:transposon Tf2-8 polyprotein [Trichonephila clavipes]|nr:transposon Tf2-8 polyprotein [Trichonephila clavipes]
MYRNVVRYVMHCRECQRRKSVPQRPPGRLVPIPPAIAPFHRIGIDLLGRFPKSAHGNKWIIVCTDYSTRYAITKALPTAEVDEIAKFLLEEIVLRHGAPRVIITDRGAVFRSRLVSSLVDLCNIDPRFTTAYHPQTNGLTERFNKTLADMLSMYVDVEQKNWDEILPFVTFAYNTAKQETTGFTPFYLLHGREAETTLDTMLPFCPNDFDDNNITKIAARAEESRQLARVHILRAQDKDRRRYDSKHQMVSYAPGDLVWVYTPVRKVGLSEKLLRRYFGPYQVLRRLSAVTYEVQGFDPASRKRKLREVVHVLRMKPYHDPAEQIETEDIPPKESYKGPITRSRIKTLEQNDSGALVGRFSSGLLHDFPPSSNLFIPFSEQPVPLVPIESLSDSVVLSTGVDYSLSFLDKFSSYMKVVRTVAWIFRFYHNSKSVSKVTGPLYTHELETSIKKVVKLLQNGKYHTELTLLKCNKPLPKSSKLQSLNVFLDSEGILRVGGRLRLQQTLKFEQKPPMLIPKEHHLTSLVIRHFRRVNFHAGQELVLSLIRQQFWIPHGKSAVKKELRNCIDCFKLVAKPVSQMMGDLPIERINPGRAFEKVGIDFAGPITIKCRHTRKANNFKSYICLFICICTKAVHLELVSSLSAAAFLSAQRRFVSRPGYPSDIYSDNGTNFVGASAYLKDLFQLLHNSNIQDYSSSKKIQWHFIPPYAPNFGGVWKASLKLTKEHLLITLKATVLNLEEFHSEVEKDVLFSRAALLPQHPAVPNQMDAGQERPNGRIPRPHIKTPASFRTRWTPGRIVATHPGTDGICRVVTIQTSSGVMTRSVSQVAVLPLPPSTTSSRPPEDVKKS